MSEPTQEELIARIDDRKDRDMFGFERGEYIPYLTPENAAPLLRPGSEFKTTPWSRESIIEDDARVPLVRLRQGEQPAQYLGVEIGHALHRVDVALRRS